MPQLKADEWPADDEPTTTEREVPVSEEEADAAAEFRARAERRDEQHPPDTDGDRKTP